MDSTTKRILVLMSTYNGEKHLREQIDSILNQKTKYHVYLRIRDDGSKDSTCNIINEYVHNNPDFVKLDRGKNTGYNVSFFNLIRNASGYDYYAISDQDDVWLPNKLQIACDAIDNEPEDIPVLYASTSYLVHDDLKPYGFTRKKERELSFYNTIVQNICPGHSQVLNNRLLELLKTDDIDSLRIYVYDSWIANVANLYGKIVFDNGSYTYYRQYEGNQLGSGVGALGQLLTSMRRVETGDGLKYRKQIEYFVEKYENKLKAMGYFEDLHNFITADTFLKRIRYCLLGKTYRQSRIETLALKCAILMGKY